MKNKFYNVIILLIVFITSCNSSNSNEYTGKINLLEEKVKVLQELKEPKLGLDGIMLSIQTHHEKLYYACKEENWDLSSFLIHELEEGFEDVQKYHPIHDEIDLNNLVLNLALPAIKKLEVSIKDESKENFDSNFMKLTNACNSCHIATNHQFIKIQLPTTRRFTNQNFSIK